jgi:hypothetical protein
MFMTLLAMVMNGMLDGVILSHLMNSLAKDGLKSMALIIGMIGA